MPRSNLFQKCSSLIDVFINVLFSIYDFAMSYPLDFVEPNNGASPIYDNSNNIPQTVASSPSDESEALIHPSPLKIVPDKPMLEIGSVVEVDFEKMDLYGVICWIGPLSIPGASSSNTRVMVGIELEEEPLDVNVNATDGTYNGVR